MSLNCEAAQLVVGAAVLDPRFCARLFRDREEALKAVDRLPGTPPHLHLTAYDRKTLAAIKADTLVEFARAVERLRHAVPPPGRHEPAAREEIRVG